VNNLRIIICYSLHH